MYGISHTSGWADRLNVGDTVIVERAFGSRLDAFSTAKVEAVTATSVTVNGVAYRRGKGRSQYVEYQNEGSEIARLSSSHCGKIHPHNTATKNWLRRERAAVNRERKTNSAYKAIIKAAGNAHQNGHLSKLTKALDALGGDPDAG